MSHKFFETRYYVLENNSGTGDDFYGCPIAHFLTSEEAIAYSDKLAEKGKSIKVEEVTWHNESHRSHQVIYNISLVQPGL